MNGGAVREGSRVVPQVYRVELFYALNPWALRPDGFMTADILATVYATPKGKDQASLELELIQIYPTGGRWTAEPKNKTVRIYMMETIAQALRDQSGKDIRPFLWSIIDWEEER